MYYCKQTFVIFSNERLNDNLIQIRDTYSPKVLVIPRNRWLRLNMTGKLFTGTLNKNQNKKQKNLIQIDVIVNQDCMPMVMLSK